MIAWDHEGICRPENGVRIKHIPHGVNIIREVTARTTVNRQPSLKER